MQEVAFEEWREPSEGLPIIAIIEKGLETAQFGAALPNPAELGTAETTEAWQGSSLAQTYSEKAFRAQGVEGLSRKKRCFQLAEGPSLEVAAWEEAQGQRQEELQEVE